MLKRKRQLCIDPSSSCGNKAAASRTANTKVTMALTPSRESHEVRHCENARQARAGLPRCSIELSRPMVDSTMASAIDHSSGRGDTSTNSDANAAQNSRPYPAPESVVKKMTESAGCMGAALRG